MSGNWQAGLHALTPVLMYFAGFILFMLVMWIVGIRLMVKGKILATFHKNRKKTGGLFKIDSDDNCIWVRSKGDPHGERYDVNEDMIEDVEWPSGFPTMFQTTIRSLEYVRFVPTPFHPEKHTSKTTARTNKLVQDENVLKAVYEHAKQSLGLQKSQSSMIIMICMAAIMVLSLFSVYTGMKASNAAAANTTKLQNIENALGIITTPVKK